MSTSLPAKVRVLQEQLCLTIAAGMPSGWESVRFHYEHYPTEAETFEMSTSSCIVAGGEKDYDLSLDTIDLLVEMKSLIEQDGQEPWTQLDFHLSANGTYKMEFGYGLPPLVAGLYGDNA